MRGDARGKILEGLSRPDFSPSSLLATLGKMFKRYDLSTFKVVEHIKSSKNEVVRLMVEYKFIFSPGSFSVEYESAPQAEGYMVYLDFSKISYSINSLKPLPGYVYGDEWVDKNNYEIGFHERLIKKPAFFVIRNANISGFKENTPYLCIGRVRISAAEIRRLQSEGNVIELESLDIRSISDSITHFSKIIIGNIGLNLMGVHLIKKGKIKSP